MMMKKECKARTEPLNPCLNKNVFCPIKFLHKCCKMKTQKQNKIINFLSCCFMCTSHLIMSFSLLFLQILQANLCRLESAIENVAKMRSKITLACTTAGLNEICRCFRLHTSHNWWLFFGSYFGECDACAISSSTLFIQQHRE